MCGVGRRAGDDADRENAKRRETCFGTRRKRSAAIVAAGLRSLHNRDAFHSHFARNTLPVSCDPQTIVTFGLCLSRDSQQNVSSPESACFHAYRSPALALIVANAATLVAALIFHWAPAWLLWPYWIQSVIIGWYARQRMLNFVQFSTEGFTSNGRRVPEDDSGKRMTANFFVLHYGVDRKIGAKHAAGTARAP